MIDLKRADFLLKSLRFAAQSLKSSDKWQPSVFHTEVAAPAIDLAAEYGLPDNLDLDTPPELAFPDLSSRDHEGALPLSPSFGDRVGSAVVAVPDLAPMPTVGGCKDGPGCPQHTVRADYPVTPEMLEIHEIYNTVGPDAATVRMNQLDRNRHRRELRSNRKHYAELALKHNLRIAAEKLAAQKLAATQQAQPETTSKKSPASAWDVFENQQEEAKSTA